MRVLLFSLFFLSSSTLASKILPFNAYSNNRICNYYYVCGCNKVADERSLNFDNPKVSKKVFHSTNISCMNAIWPDFTNFVHEASSSLPSFTPVTKGQVVGEFVVPHDGFVHNNSRRLCEGTSYFVFFGPKRASNVDALRRIGFPSLKEVASFHHAKHINFFLKYRGAPEISIDDFYFFTNESKDHMTVRRLKDVQTFLSQRKDWQRLVRKRQFPKIQKFIQNHFPGTDVHLISVTSKEQPLKLYFRPFTLIPPEAMIAMKLPTAKFEPIDAWRVSQYSCVLAADERRHGMCNYFILFIFDAMMRNDKEDHNEVEPELMHDNPMD